MIRFTQNHKKIKHEIYARKTKKVENLKFLSSTIKTYLSNNISKEFIGIPPNSNEKIISRLLQEEDKKDIFNLSNELRVEDWLNIFIYQYNNFYFNLIFSFLFLYYYKFSFK